jgi:hypothetical protein
MPQLKTLIFENVASPFWHFLSLSDALYAKLKLTHTINQDRLFLFVYEWLKAEEKNEIELQKALLADYQQTGNKHPPAFLSTFQSAKTPVNSKGMRALVRQQRRIEQSTPPLN